METDFNKIITDGLANGLPIDEITAHIKSAIENETQKESKTTWIDEAFDPVYTFLRATDRKPLLTPTDLAKFVIAVGSLQSDKEGNPWTLQDMGEAAEHLAHYIDMLFAAIGATEEEAIKLLEGEFGRALQAIGDAIFGNPEDSRKTARGKKKEKRDEQLWRDWLESL